MKWRLIIHFGGNLLVNFIKQDGCVIAYAPALDLSTYGSDEKEARKNFGEILHTFMESFKDARELDQVLQSLGWEKTENKAWQPPKVTQTEINLDTVFA